MSPPGSQLTPDQVQRLKELFDAALKLDASERDAFIADAYRKDDSLQAGVEPVGLSEAETIEMRPAEPIEVPSGKRIGPYSIIREIGKGGMGVVYLAGRADQEFEKLVAIKLLRPGPDNEEILQRFRIERQILATLDHPNIVKMLDGGTTEEGFPTS